MSDQAYKTPLVDHLRSVPKDHRTEWATQWSEDGAETGHAMCPIGRLAHEAADRITEQTSPNEQGKNRYGLDMAYFRNLINRELNRPLVDFKPDELARVFARASRTADPAVMHEPEFAQATPPAVASVTKDQISEGIFGYGLRNEDGHNLSMDDTDEMAEHIMKQATPPAAEVEPVGVIDHALMSGVVWTEAGGSLPHGTKLYTAPPPAAVPEPVRPHKWDADGERCVNCGDKDWMASPSCDGSQQKEDAK